LLTPLDWQERWDTPPDTIPYFDKASEVRIGEQLVILTFFTNPGINESGNSFERQGVYN